MSQGKDRPDLRVVDGREDPVLRRQRFELVHPDAVILAPSAGRWRAIVPPGLIPGDGTRTTLGAWNLEDELDRDVLAAVSRGRCCVAGFSSALLCGGAFLE